MNTLLEKQLKTAHKIFSYKNEHYDIPIQENKKIIYQCKSAYSNRRLPKPPAERIEEQKISDILLLLFLWPVGLANMRKHKKEQAELEIKANVRYVEEMILYEQFGNEMHENIQKALHKIKCLESERDAFKQANAAYLSFLNPHYHSLGWVEDILYYVSSGRADSEKEAVNSIIADRQRELEQEEERLRFEEDMEQRKKFHEESMAAARNIQKSLDEFKQDRIRWQQRLSQYTWR